MSSKLCLFAALFLPGLAEATVTVSSVPSGPAYITYSVTTVSPGVFDVSITRQSYAGDVFVDIRGLVTDSIRNVTVNSGASPRKTFFSVRGPSAGDSITSVESFVESGGSGYTEITELRTSGDVGDGVATHDAIKVDGWTGGNIDGFLTGKTSLTNGQLSNVSVADGVSGNITVSSSSLIKLEVTSGAIGSIGTPIAINVGGSIHDLKATEIHAAIDTDYGGIHGSVLRLQTTTGDFSGSLQTNFLTAGGQADPGIFIAGDCDANLEFLDRVTQPITIGDKLNGDIDITDAGALDAQIIINADNNVYTNWTDAWVGDVIVDGTTVTPGAYPDTDLGDGAVGLARFTLHKEACDPPEGSTLAAGDAPTLVKLAHYGPYLLYPDVTNKPHVRIDRRYIGSTPPGPWSLVGGSYSVDTGASTDRILAIKKSAGGTWDAGYEYRIRHDPPSGMVDPIYGYLKCAQVASTPALRMYTDSPGGYEYFLTINP